MAGRMDPSPPAVRVVTCSMVTCVSRLFRKSAALVSSRPLRCFIYSIAFVGIYAASVGQLLLTASTPAHFVASGIWFYHYTIASN